jgi:sulfur-oxidizing protein SoxX
VVAAVSALPALPGRAGEPIVAYTITDGAEIRESLTGAPGDPERGRQVYETEPRAGCPACHGVPGSAGGAPQGPELTGVGARLAPGAIRLWLVAPEALKPDTSMPPFYAAGQRRGADDPLYGGPELTADEIEDLVAYLAGQR